jgi:hypothetical protein
MRTSTLSARWIVSAAMMTGLRIGRLTAIGSIDLICTCGHLQKTTIMTVSYCNRCGNGV